MKIENKKDSICIKADEGKVLTKDGFYGKEVWLGKGDSPDNWKEVSEEEEIRAKEAIEQERIKEKEERRVKAIEDRREAKLEKIILAREKRIKEKINEKKVK